MKRGYKPTLRDRIGVPILNTLMRVLLSPGYRAALHDAVTVGLILERALSNTRQEPTDAQIEAFRVARRDAEARDHAGRA